VAIASRQGGKNRVGKVYLIGAGPDDPGLLTVKALRILEIADVVIPDWRMSAKYRHHLIETDCAKHRKPYKGESL